jgi:hypothetical protein
MAQGYAFGRPAPLPSTAQLLIEELTDAPVQEMTEQTPEALTGPAPEPARGSSLTETADLTDELADLTEDAAADTGAAPELPVQRTSGPTGEFPRPTFPGPADGEPDPAPED